MSDAKIVVLNRVDDLVNKGVQMWKYGDTELGHVALMMEDLVVYADNFRPREDAVDSLVRLAAVAVLAAEGLLTKRGRG